MDLEDTLGQHILSEERHNRCWAAIKKPTGCGTSSAVMDNASYMPEKPFLISVSDIMHRPKMIYREDSRL